MTNELIDYYREQAGNGISGFSGVKYQRGHGFFGRFLSKAIYPLLRFLGRQALSTGVNFASDIIKDKKNWRMAGKHRLKDVGTDILTAGLERAKRFQQTGEGKRKRKRRRKTKKSKLNLVNKTIKRRSKKKKTRRRRKKRVNSLF